MKKVLLVLIMLFSLFILPLVISAETTVDRKATTLNKLSILQGDGINFNLNGQLKRSEAITFIVRILGKEPIVKANNVKYSSTTFTDVKTTDWFAAYVGYCEENNLLNGFPDGGFHPNELISEKAFLKLVLGVLGYTYGQDFVWDTIYESSFNLGLVADVKYKTQVDDNLKYLRSDVVSVLYDTLTNNLKGQKKTIIDALLEANIVSRTVAVDLGLAKEEITKQESIDTTLTNADGSYYVGHTTDGLKNGTGTYTYSDGTKYIGEWKDDKRQGTGEIISKNFTFKGEFYNGTMNGTGVTTSSDGSVLSGSYKDGELDGTVTFVLADKTSSIGTFVAGKQDGITSYFDAQGNLVSKKEYNNGVFVKDIPLEVNVGSQITDEVGVTGNITTSGGLKSYLEKNFSTIQTSIGSTNFKFTIIENNSILMAYDYWVMMEYDFNFFYELQYSNKITSEMREKVKQELKDFQEKVGRAIVSLMPTKKFDGGYYYSWYKYPNLKIDLITRQYYSWKNYEGSLIDGYENTNPSVFRWNDSLDDDL